MTRHDARAALADETARQVAECALLVSDRFASDRACEQAGRRLAARARRIRQLARALGADARAGG